MVAGAAPAAEGVALTEGAVERLRELAAQSGASELLLRVSVDGGGCSGFQYQFDLVGGEDVSGHDRVFDEGGAEREGGGGKGEGGGGAGEVRAGVVVDDVSLTFLRGATVDFTSELIRSSFVVSDNPNSSEKCGCGSSFSVEI
eukprot:PRCOL_00000026-RA